MLADWKMAMKRASIGLVLLSAVFVAAEDTAKRPHILSPAQAMTVINPFVYAASSVQMPFSDNLWAWHNIYESSVAAGQITLLADDSGNEHVPTTMAGCSYPLTGPTLVDDGTGKYLQFDNTLNPVTGLGYESMRVMSTDDGWAYTTVHTGAALYLMNWGFASEDQWRIDEDYMEAPDNEGQVTYSVSWDSEKLYATTLWAQDDTTIGVLITNLTDDSTEVSDTASISTGLGDEAHVDCPQSSGGPLTIGAQAKSTSRESGDRGFDNRIYEVIIHDAPLGATNAQTLHDWLQNKYADIL
jgi:hypothetical protein